MLSTNDPEEGGRFLRTALWFVFVVSAAVGPALGQRLLSTRVAQFEFHGGSGVESRGHLAASGYEGIDSAILALALHAQVRICGEALPRSASDAVAPIEIDVQDKTVGEILEQMVEQDPRYQYRERLGVIEVLPVGAEKDANSCLNMVIPELRVYHPWHLAWSQVRCAIELLTRDPAAFVPDPFAENCISRGGRLSHPPGKVLRSTFFRTSVRDILDQLASMAGNVAWSANFNGNSRSCRDLELVQYQPRTWYAVDPDSDDNKMAEGLPQKCRSCHYHRPATPH